MADLAARVSEKSAPEFSSRLAERNALGTPDDALPDWSGADVELAKAVWARLTETAKRLFSTMMDRPDEKFSGDELAHLAGIDGNRRLVAASLGKPGVYCRAVGRTQAWNFEYPKDRKCRYSMSQNVAALFRQAQDV